MGTFPGREEVMRKPAPSADALEEVQEDGVEDLAGVADLARGGLGGEQGAS